MIDAAFVEEIRKMAEAGCKPELIDVEANHRVLVVAGKVIHTFRKDEPFGKTKVVEFSSLLDAAIVLVEKAEIAVIQVSNNGITLACDVHKPHDFASVRLDFQLTAAYSALLDWESRQKTVSAINKMLRTTLFGTFDDKLISIFRQIEFARAGATTVAKAAHRDTMGKTVENAVKSMAGELPEIISFETPLFLNAPCEPVTLRYFVDVNHDAEAIGLAAIGDAAAQGTRATVFAIIERLKQELPKALVLAS
jgi:hypothetical protein